MLLVPILSFSGIIFIVSIQEDIINSVGERGTIYLINFFNFLFMKLTCTQVCKIVPFTKLTVSQQNYNPNYSPLPATNLTLHSLTMLRDDCSMSEW